MTVTTISMRSFKLFGRRFVYWRRTRNVRSTYQPGGEWS